MNDPLKPTRHAMPSNAVLVGGTVGAPTAVILAWILQTAGLVVPAEVAAALGAVVTAIVSYFPRGGRRD
jgi:ABC-type enterobactin transport system permease subunit